ncbi:MAG: hypothetical protein HKN21_07055 [Candidatus Eisenbacteria bacterium]|uniref:DUF7305 domain-containing protein n=1 Tax=Eiseniibacteriota bacterium TaxID=2212470 RepID=A0A7Y2H299_UNCEI|nr:hypothetical protein [Candidatus Eisenbacteria bacterium]
MILFVLGLMGTLFLKRATTETQSSGTQERSTKAFFYAEAGISEAFARMELPPADSNHVAMVKLPGWGAYLVQNLGDSSQDPDRADQLSDGLDNDLDGTIDEMNEQYPEILSQQSGNVDYPWVKVRHRLTNTGQIASSGTGTIVVVTAMGKTGVETRTVQIEGVTDNPIWMEWAMFGVDFTQTTGSGDVHGPVGSNGDIYSNGDIFGPAFAGGTVSNHAYVTGDITEGMSPLSLPDVDCPTTPYGPAPTGPGVSFNATTGDLSIHGGATSTFPAGTYYFRNFTKTGTGHMEIAVGDEVEIFISEDMQLTGNGFYNLNNVAANLKIWGCGTDSDTWNISGSNTSYLIVYAPHHPIRLNGSGDLRGSVIGYSIDKIGSGDVIFDNGASGSGSSYARASWREL